MNKEYPDWTDPITQQILIGSLLDGGRFGIQGTNKETVQYLETHTLERKGHTQWKNKYLKCQYSEYDDRKVSLSSRWHPELDELYAKYYKDGRKNIPILLNNLDMNGLCVWYTCANTVINSGKSIQLATTDFTDDEQFLARDWFIKNLETLPLPQSRRVSGRQDRYLLFSDEDAQILRRTVAQTALDLLNRPNL